MLTRPPGPHGTLCPKRRNRGKKEEPRAGPRGGKLEGKEDSTRERKESQHQRQRKCPAQDKTRAKTCITAALRRLRSSSPQNLCPCMSYAGYRISLIFSSSPSPSLSPSALVPAAPPSLPPLPPRAPLCVRAQP